MQLLELAALAAALLTWTTQVHADTLEVGPSRSYATPCEAVAAAKPQDDIAIAPGTYTDTCAINVAGLTLHGQGGVPKIDLSGTDHPAEYKAIYVIAAASVTIEDLELTGAHISDDNGANGAALRVEASGLTVRGCNIHDNQEGVLGGTTGTLTIEHSEFYNNGLSDGCDQGGCTHNVYVGNIDTLYFRFNWSHHIATDTADKGHLLKSRAKANYILYNRLTGEDGFDSYEIDLPNGGLGVIVGNQIQKGARSGNSNMLSWGEEGASNPDKRLFVANNTFVNDFGSGKFLSVGGATLSAHNNIFAGSGSVGSSDGMSTDNWVGSDPGFVDAAHFDDHLHAGSPAIGKAVNPGMADQFSLTPVSEYLQPLLAAMRATAHDCGAFEFGTKLAHGVSEDADAGVVAAAGTVSGGTGGVGRAPDDASGRDAGAAGSSAPTYAAHSGGCGCMVTGEPAADGGGMFGLGIVCLCWWSRRSRARRLP